MIKKKKRKKNETALEGKKKRNNILLCVSISGKTQKSSFLSLYVLKQSRNRGGEFLLLKKKTYKWVCLHETSRGNWV